MQLMFKLILFLLVNIFSQNIWGTSITTENGNSFYFNKNTGANEVIEVSVANSAESKVLLLSDKLFLKYGGVRSLCAETSDISRQRLADLCVKSLEKIIEMNEIDWSILSGIYLSDSSIIPSNLQDSFCSIRDKYGFVWLKYDFDVPSVIYALEEIAKCNQIRVTEENLISKKLNRKILFNCFDKAESCNEIVKLLFTLDSQSLDYLRNNSWISNIQVWSSAETFPRIAPDGSFSKYQLNLKSNDDRQTINKVMRELKK